MSITLRGMLSSAWNTFLHINPVTGPYMLGKKMAESEVVRDTVKVTAENARKAAQAVSETTSAVLDYPLDEGAKKVVAATSDAIETGARAVKDSVETGAKAVKDSVQTGARYVADGVEAGVQAVDEVQKEARRDVADWISPGARETEAAPAPGAKLEPAEAAPAPETVAVPQTPAETKAFQEKFNEWLASEEGTRARESGLQPLKVDSILGPMTTYALVLYNAR